MPRPCLAGKRLLGSPDVMFCTSDSAELLAGTAPLVLAECHDSLILWGWAMQLHPDPDTVREAGRALLEAAAGRHRLGSVIGTQRTKIIPFRFPGPVVDVGGAEPVAIPIADISVKLADGRLVCLACDGDPFLLHNGGFTPPAHNVLSPPRLVPVALSVPGTRPTRRASRSGRRLSSARGGRCRRASSSRRDARERTRPRRCCMRREPPDAWACHVGSS